MIKVLIFDIDDTLIKQGESYVKKSAVEGINQAYKNGYKIIVATGRGYYLMQQDVPDSLPVDYYVTVNGSCINDRNGNVIKCYKMNDEDVDRLIDICLERKYSFAIKFDDSLRTYYNHEDFCEKYCSYAIPRSSVIDETATRSYHKTHGNALDFFIYSDHNEAYDLKDQFPNVKFVSPTVGLDACEAFMGGLSKGRCLRELVESLGYSLDECMSFGDSENDIEMIEMCKIGVAMGNALGRLKGVADYVTDDIDNDGVYNALKHFEII